MKSEGTIHFGPRDRLEGRLNFEGDVVVEGHVEGGLELTGRLELRDGGAVMGSVRVARLQVEEGAVLEGNVQVSDGSASAPVVRAAAMEAVQPAATVATVAAVATVTTVAQREPAPAVEPEPAAEVVAEAPAVAVAVMDPDPEPPASPLAAGDDGFTPLFDGVTKAGWRLAGAGEFRVVDGTLEAVPDASGELGLLWHLEPTPRDFVLKLEWKLGQPHDNSGVHLRFPDPGSKGYLNQAWVAVDFGLEVQVDEYGWPDRAGKHRTGAFYDQDGQTLTQRASNPPGEWNEFEIRARGQDYTVLLNGQQVSRFKNKDRERALPSTAEAPTYVGLQIHPPGQGQKQAGGRVAFRNIRIKPL